jgi:hypothetical protein
MVCLPFPFPECPHGSAPTRPTTRLLLHTGAGAVPPVAPVAAAGAVAGAAAGSAPAPATEPVHGSAPAAAAAAAAATPPAAAGAAHWTYAEQDSWGGTDRIVQWWHDNVAERSFPPPPSPALQVHAPRAWRRPLLTSRCEHEPILCLGVHWPALMRLPSRLQQTTSVKPADPNGVKPLSFAYTPVTGWKLANNGHTVQACISTLCGECAPRSDVHSTFV